MNGNIAKSAGLIVALVGVMVGFFIWRTFVTPVEQSYVADFSGSDPIRASTPSSVAFFRKKYFIAGKVQHAWLAVAASQDYTLFVNGALVQNVRTTDPDARTVFDITNYMAPGKNVIAVTAYRQSFPEPAWLRITGSYTTGDGRSHPIRSDTTWRANETEHNLIRATGAQFWYDPSYDDTRWPRAVAYPVQQAPGFPILFDDWPVVYATAPRGPWLWGPGGGHVTLSRRFHVDFGAREKIWIRLSGLCPYRLSLNGRTVAVRTESEKTFDNYDLEPLVRWGENHLELHVERFFNNVGVIAELFVGTNSGKLRVYRGVSAWNLRVSGGRAPVSPTPLASYPAYPGYALTEQTGQTVLPWWYYWRAGATCLFLGALMALVALGHWRLWCRIWRERASEDRVASSLAFFHAPAGLFLIAVFLLGFDIRLSPGWPYHTWVILTAACLLVGGQVLGGLLVERKSEEWNVAHDFPGGVQE